MATVCRIASAVIGILLLGLGNSDARAVNISNTWILPQEGFPVFYRYFRDRISWYEADAVCQFHHANLVTVDTTAQYDAARAYLKELDIMSNVWIGLIKSNEEGDFSWTDYKPLSGEGYWGAAPTDGRAPLCAALDPARDFRWAALSCGGPQVASFICELPVPAWALSETNGCLVRSLPSLTVQYLPELAAVRLASDCGLDGTRSVTCKANEGKKDLMKELSCFILDEEFTDNAVTAGLDSASSGSTSHRAGTWSSNPTTPAAGDYSSSTRLRRETPDTSTPMSIPTTTAIVGSSQAIFTNRPTEPSKLKPTIVDQTTTTTTTKATIIDTTTQVTNQTTSAKSVEITPVSENPSKASSAFTEHPKLNANQKLPIYENLSKTKNVSTLKNIPTQILLDSSKTHLPLPNLIGNSVEENKSQKEHIDIYTQATDHFIPPLVMAKSKLSTDMTLVSPESKHLHKASVHYSPTHAKVAQHIETTSSPVINMKPTITKAADIASMPLAEITTQNVVTKSSNPDLTTNTENQSTIKPIDELLPKEVPTTNVPTTNQQDEVPNTKYKKPIKGKKYDKLKEEKKKVKEAVTVPSTLATDNNDKVIKITLTSTMGTSEKPTVIEVTTRLPEAPSTVGPTLKPKVVEDKTLSTEGPTTKIMIDPNIMKLNKGGTPNNDSESISANTTNTVEVTTKKVEENSQTTSEENKSSNSTETGDNITDPEPVPRPNRSRLLTHPPQHRSFYPYFFNRVLG
ncbi:uncharacterized protein LOC143918308 [Arctopsyche grandis]|uniref:uncharacterized protein LOC143918308 n=1 Tax=Arctopsyche grandis TaxID=121162 RepID=UPI00406D6C2D